MKVSNLLILIFVCASVSALSGVNPRSYEVDFKSGYEGDFVFDFVIEGDSSAYLSVEGSLSECVTLDKRKVSGSERVIAHLILPMETDNPGINQIMIVAEEDETNVVGLIKVRVPYPEEYIEVEVIAPNANVEEAVNISLNVSNRGKREFFIVPRVEIYAAEEEIKSFNLSKVLLLGDSSKEFEVILNSTGYSAGNYSAVVLVEYGDKVARAENPFRLGEFFVELVDYTHRLSENEVNRFEIVVESFWDDIIEDMSAEVIIKDFEDANFVTDTVELKGWRRGILTGFFDTTLVSGYNIDAEIILRYNEERISKDVELRIVRGVDYVPYIVGASVLIILALLIWRGLVFIRKLKN